MSNAMSQPDRKASRPFQRLVVTYAYLFDLAILGYFLYGAITGELPLLGKRGGTLDLRGPAAWLACGLPLSFIAATAISLDLALRVSDSMRRVLLPICLALGFASLAAAVLL